MEEFLIPGSSHLSLRPADNSDIPLILEFCNKCEHLGFLNNKDLKSIKWDWIQTVGKYYIGIDSNINKIFTMAGYHPLEQIDKDSWRILFRGAQLTGYTPQVFSKNQLRTSIHFGHILYLQIKDILKINPNARIYMSTNLYSNEDAPRSARLNQSTTPILEKQRLITLEFENIELYYTKQNLWRINVDEYIRQRSEIYLGS